METVTIRLPQAVKEELEAEADAADRTLSAHIRHELERRESRTSLKQRIEALEREVYERTQANTARTPAGTNEHEGRTPPNTNEHQGRARPTTDEYDLLAGVDVAGDGDLASRRREAAQELLGWLRERGEARKADIEEEWLTDEIVEMVAYDAGRSVWYKFCQRVLSSSRFVELNGSTWRWVG